MQEEQLELAGLKQVQLAAVREILHATTSALPLEEILPLITNVMIIAFDALTSWLMLVEDGQLRMVVARGENAAELTGTSSSMAAGVAGMAVLSQQLTIVSPHSIDPADPILGPLAHQREPVVLLPIKAADEVRGLLGAVVSMEATRDVSFLVTLAEQTSVALESARLRAEARTWRHWLDAIVEQMHDPVLVYDQHGTLVLLNPTAQQWLQGRGVQVGDALADVARKTDLRDEHGHVIPEVEMAEARALRGEVVDNLEQQIAVLPGQSIHHVLAKAVPLRTNGQIDGAVVVWRDITTRKRVEQERNQLLVREQLARAEAQEALRMRDAFLSIASHELNNPLTVMLGQAHLLQSRAMREGGLCARDQRALAVIAEQARRLSTLITTMLDVSRIERGQLSIRRSPMDVCAFVRRIVANIQPTLEQHTLTCNTPDAPLPVDGDTLRLEQVLNNLISNAIKYSPQGGAVSVAVTQRGDTVRVAVSDQGIGIPQKSRANLFQRFYRGDNVTSGMSGTGVGLYVVKELVTLHGGTVEVESSEGQGSTFTICLPCAVERVDCPGE